MLETLSILCYFGIRMPSNKASSADNQQERLLRGLLKKVLLLILVLIVLYLLFSLYKNITGPIMAF